MKIQETDQKGLYEWLVEGLEKGIKDDAHLGENWQAMLSTQTEHMKKKLLGGCGGGRW